MILGEERTATTRGGAETPTLDDLFRQVAARKPDAIALTDPPNRESFTCGPPRRLSYAEADRIVSAIAAQLRALGLPTDAVVAIQLPNTVEMVLTLLGVLRAGLIAAPLPLLWRRTEAAAALARLDAKAIVTARRVGDTDHGALAMQIAADTFTIRHVCGFGPGLGDGVIPLDELFVEAASQPAAEIAREGNAALHVALVTWDVTPEGPVAVARNHAELIAGGLAGLLEGALGQDATLLGCCALSSFSGLAVTLMPWLLCGGTLALHHAFDGEAFLAQCRDERCNALVLPGALVPKLAEAGLLALPDIKTVLALWRAPERLLNTPPWGHPGIRLVDLLAFGEIAVIGSRRDGLGFPMPPAAGAILAPRGSENAIRIAEVARTRAGTLAVRGPMVPRHAFPPGAERLSEPCLRAEADGSVDTGYACRVDRTTETFTITGPPPGLVSVGGYRFVLNELKDAVRRANGGAFVTALPDALAGHRLAGVTGKPDEARTALLAQGANPLLANAFKAKTKAA